MKQAYTYILTNKNNKVLYVGVTNDLKTRIYQHKTKHNLKSFTAKYNINKLVYFEQYNNMLDAIAREKQIKAGSRQKKINLINEINNEWRDLYDDL